MIWNFKETPEFKQAINASLAVWDLGKEEILSRCRQEPLSTARAILMVTVWERSKMSLSAIGRAFNRDHSTIMHHTGGHTDRLFTDPDYKENFLAIKEYLDNK
jgi:chromosomal replication initiation ATPase DnaA